MKDSRNLPFEALLNRILNPSSASEYNQAWHLFMERYRPLIESAVQIRCRKWDSASLRLQLSDVVDDCISDVLEILYKNDCRALRNYRNKTNEGQFKAWLTMIAKRAAGRRLKGRTFERVVTKTETGETEDLPDYVMNNVSAGLEREQTWELYEDWVETIREVKKRGGNTERDIHIFLLYALADFDQSMITALPAFKNGKKIGHRVVDNVVNRMRNTLRDNWNPDRLDL